MEAYVPSRRGSAAIQFVQDKMPQLTLSTYFAVLVFLLIATRFVTGINSRRQNGSDGAKPLRVRKAPYWIPFIGHSPTPERAGREFIAYHIFPINEPIVALQAGSVTLNMVLSPFMARDLLSHPAATAEPFYHRAMKVFFGDKGLTSRMDPKHKESLAAAQSALTQEPHVNQLSQAVVKLIENETANLTSFNRSLVDQAIWERDAHVTVVDGSDPPVGEARLFSLTRNFTGWVTTSLFLGKSFIDFYPTFWEDLWNFRSQSDIVASRLPAWMPVPGLAAGYAARERLLKAITSFEAALRSIDDDRDPGFDFREMEDVSEIMRRRARVLREAGYSAREAAHIELEFISRMHVDVSSILFWSLLHLYQEPKLLSAIRDEIAPFVTAKRPRPEDTGFPFAEPPRVSCDLDSLLKSCPLLKATYFETLRLHTDSFSYREILEDLILTESAEDSTIFASGTPRSYQLQKGATVVVPHGVHQVDPRFFEEPKIFDPHRFIITDPKTGRSTADMMSMRPFGDGSVKCKGQMIADSEILSAVATIISLWNIEPTDAQGWKIPRRKNWSLEFIPLHDVRVRLNHRI